MFDRHGRRSQHVFLKIRPDDPCQRRLIHLDLNCEVDLYLSVDATATVVIRLSSIYSVRSAYNSNGNSVTKFSTWVRKEVV
jgi:hypothetical protein